jgi:hypothetical protein
LLSKLLTGSVRAFFCAGIATAQTDLGSRTGPSNDDLIAYLSLTDTQVSCLDTNKTAFRNAVSSSLEQLRELQGQLREAARSGEETAGIQSQIDSLRASIQSTQTTYVSSAHACLTSAQQTQVGQLVQAETLPHEVRQGIGLLLLQSTEERTDNAFGTGLGATSPSYQAGQIPQVLNPANPPASVTANVSVTIGGIALSLSDIAYAGVAPCCAGLYQLVLKVPENAPDGNLPLVVAVNEVSSPQGPFVAVARP